LLVFYLPTLRTHDRELNHNLPMSEV